jgi:hypothetical protein
MSDQRDTFEIPGRVPITVKRSSIQIAFDSIVMNETCHHDGMDRSDIEETYDFVTIVFR